MTRRGKFVRRSARRYLEWREYAAWTLSLAWHQALGSGARPLEGPIEVEATICHRPGRRADIDNLGKAVLDAGNGILWRDDRQVVRLVLQLREVERGQERLELSVRFASAAD